MRQRVTNEAISDILYRMFRDHQVSFEEREALNRWISISRYNRSVYEDVTNDTKLRLDLTQSYNAAQFWKILITHRAAMHDDFGVFKGNFWHRILRNTADVFRHAFTQRRGL